LYNPALTQVKDSFAVQKPITKQRFGPLYAGAFQKIAVVSHKYILYEIRVIEQKRSLGTKLEIDNVSIFFGDFC
jgi:hypothetical protein